MPSGQRMTLGIACSPRQRSICSRQLSGVKHCVGRYAYSWKQDAVYISAHFHVGDTQPPGSSFIGSHILDFRLEAGLGSSQGDNLALRVLLYLFTFPILSVPAVQLVNETSLRPIQILSPSCIDEISERYPAVFIQVVVDVSGAFLYFEPAVS